MRKLKNLPSSKPAGKQNVHSEITPPPSAVPHGISAVIINYRTPDLLDRNVGLFRQWYPAAHLLIIENGSGDRSSDVARSWSLHDGSLTAILQNPRNLHHGPAMDQALRNLGSPFVLFLDSDAGVIKGGFLEKMAGILQNDQRNYAVGKLITMNRRGFDVPEGTGGFPYIRPVCFMVRRSVYQELPPFRKHGAPCLQNMIAAVRSGYHLVDFPIDEYITHKGRGTASRHGYQLGFRGIINHLLNKAGL